MRPHSVTVKRKSIWLQWAIIGHNKDEADSQERLGVLWTGNVCCSSQHFTANVFSARAASLPQDSLHWCLTSFTHSSFASAWPETAVGCMKKPDNMISRPGPIFKERRHFCLSQMWQIPLQHWGCSSLFFLQLNVTVWISPHVNLFLLGVNGNEKEWQKVNICH